MCVHVIYPTAAKERKKERKKKEEKRKEGNLSFVITKTIKCESSIQFTNTLCCLIRSGNAALGILYTMLGPVLPSSLFSLFVVVVVVVFLLSFPEINYHGLRHAARRETL